MRVAARARTLPINHFLSYTIISAVICAVSLLLITGSTCAQDIKQKEIKPKAIKARVFDAGKAFRAIEKAWRKGDASALSRYVGTGRVYLNIYGANRKGGYFSKSQVYFLLKRHFAATRQLKFGFMRLSKQRVRSNKAFGIAMRVFKDVRSGRVVNDKLYVTLRREGNKWVLSEVKSMR